MLRMVKTYLLLLVFLLYGSLSAKAQSTSSPYSVFGLGALESSSAGPYKAMGGTGIGFLSNRSVNYMNPASYSGLDSLITVFQVGIFGKYTNFSTSSENQSLINANLKYVLMGFRITPWLATSFGFSPYSSIGYNINSQSYLEGTNLSYLKTFTGEGGVNQVYLGGSVKLLKNLAVGVNAAYLFGNVTHTESATSYSYYLEDITYISNFDLNYGLNYQFRLAGFKNNIGLIYGNAKTLSTRNTRTIQTEAESQTLKKRIYKYSIPRNFGVGLAVNKEYFSAGFDYEWSNWENVTIENSIVRTRNANRYSVGVEFPSFGLNKGTGKMLFYRLGGEIRESFMVIDNTPVTYRAVTLGTGIPLKGVFSVLNLSLELGQNGTTRNGLIKESFAVFHLDMSFRDVWFRKKLYN